MSEITNSRNEVLVAAVRLPSHGYGIGPAAGGDLLAALGRTAELMDWGDEQSLFANVIPDGARVLIKPNWVMHRTGGSGGIEPLLTHASIIRAVAEAALRTGASSVIVGDAPLQSCDFDALIDACELRDWAAALAASEPRFGGLHDFRRTKSCYRNGVLVQQEDQNPAENFVLFDLEEKSLLEPITRPDHSFRVTKYDPRLMAKTHRPGRHNFLVARAVMEADVVINLPKLKTHRKAGITCALKNLIGINGNKEYLPHHRIGGSETGGDCYPGHSRIKRTLEFVHDQKNQTRSSSSKRVWTMITRALHLILRQQGDQLGVDGAWSGNDTIWRTCLDLNRILLHGTVDAEVRAERQRRVIHLVDAVVAGQGDGPLSPDPLPLGLLLGADNPASADFVGARLLGYDWRRIPIVKHAFEEFQWPLTDFSPSEVQLTGDLGSGAANELIDPLAQRAETDYPVGWRDACAPAPEQIVQAA